MTNASNKDAVFVEAPARLHFGVLDLRGELGRWFGGIGAAAPGPTLLVSAQPANMLKVVGEDADRVAEIARRVLAHYGVDAGARLRVHRTLPAHVGLGSGTQLALAVARVLGELFALETHTEALARVLGRAGRSAIGTYAFTEGGLVVEGGRRPGTEGVSPLLARLAFPPEWRCVVAVPNAPPGISGPAEQLAIDQLTPPSERDVERVAHIVLVGLLPALAEADLVGFGRSLNSIQSITGEWFAPVQGGTFRPGPTRALVDAMREWGAVGVGQSSWGPTVYGIVGGERAGRELAGRVRAWFGGAGSVHEGAFPNCGARSWRGALGDRVPPSVATAHQAQDL